MNPLWLFWYSSLMGWTRKSNQSSNRFWYGKHRAEHWYRDNQIYFFTARCRDRFPAFESEQAKEIFWTRFEQVPDRFNYHPWISTLVDNHYHSMGVLELGEQLGPMMKWLHGGTAKLVNDLLENQWKAGLIDSPHLINGRLVPFWRDTKHKNYFDGCLRNETQGRKTYRYILTQSVRHGIMNNWRNYPHTRIHVELEEAIELALRNNAFLEGVPYKRYER